MSTPLSEAEIERRLPLWDALAQLFLDTEMQGHHYAAVRDAARAGGFSADEVCAILADEVYPAFIYNLLNVAGEWTFFHRDDVRRMVLDPQLPKRWRGRAARVKVGVLRREGGRVRAVIAGADPDRIVSCARTPRRRPVRFVLRLLLLVMVIIVTWIAVERFLTVG